MTQTVTVVTIESSSLNAKSGRELIQRVTRAVGAGAKSIVVDLSKVSFMDSMGIAVLVSLTRNNSCKVVLASLNGYLSTLAKLTHLHDVFDVYASADAACFALAS